MKAIFILIGLGIAALIALGIAFIAFGVYVVATRLGMATVEPYAAGFWAGLWQGLIVLLSFFTSWFDKSITIYQTGNVGFWYNFGYIFGLCIALGGSGKAASKK
ncbi:hypothetical protein KC614_03345 [candidate division WWE3 bacterium]|uniref:Uncharacterized protein n=1 Tax=candidate division WWE3 bacterium TaxID=2053526 RepID=A0A955LKI1_UNCKA|nr:hypothetical protein [candidate division WWE3 bacterium]